MRTSKPNRIRGLKLNFFKVWSSRVWDYVFEIQRKLDTRDRCFMTRTFSSILNSLFVSFNFFDNFHRKKLQIKVKTDT